MSESCPLHGKYADAGATRGAVISATTPSLAFPTTPLLDYHSWVICKHDQCGFPLDANFHFMQRICRYFFFAPATFIANPPPGTANFLDSFAYIVFWSHFHRKFLCQFATFGQKLGSFSLSIFNCCKQSSVMLQIDNVN